MRYKEGVVQSIRPTFMAGTGEHGGVITLRCPKCQMQSDYLYGVNKDTEIYPKYCAYCGEELTEANADYVETNSHYPPNTFYTKFRSR